MKFIFKMKLEQLEIKMIIHKILCSQLGRSTALIQQMHVWLMF